MNNRLPQTISTLIWRSVVQAIIVAVLIGLFLSFIYGLLSNYKQKHQHIDQIATLLTTSASTADSADIVAEQVKFLLENEPSIQSILFYSTPQPIDNLDQSAADWKNVLFADTVSFNYPVTSNYIDINSDSNELNSNSYASQTLSERINEASETNQATTDSVLVGYINITLDMQAMREYWYRTNLLGLLIIIIIAVLWVLCILRKLKWPVRDIESLTEVCEVVLENPSIDQLPVISQHFNFQDLILIKRTFVVLFNRLQKVKQEYEAVVALEQQLHTKDISLDVQLHNFQSMITHELKTSLNAIVGGLQLLDHDALNREQKDAVEIISSGSEKLVSSLDHIIQLNQIKKGQIHINYSEFNPLQLIADILVEFEPIAQKKGLELVSRVHHIDYSLKGDAEKIQQILSILLSNAIKFTPVGQVIITSQLTHFDKSNRWQISVKDTGIGIDSHHIDDIFNPFFQVDSSKTRQYEGSGVGLPIVKQMIQLMGATIEVESTLGVGTQFIITIAMPTIQHSWQQSLLAGLTFIYYYYDEVGFLGAELEHLGAAVIYCQHEQLVIDEMKANKVDMVMFAEDVFPRKAESLASRIRKAEDDHRALLVYWYSPHQAQYLDSFEHGLKVAGIDYCCSAIYKDKDLSDLLQRWLVWK